MASKRSPFLYPGTHSVVDKLSIIHLKRDLQLPTILKDHDEDDEGYTEGKVVNTRFGSFPHSTLIGKPWGSQVTASRVDTGSRGRNGQPQENKKRKAKEKAAERASKRTKTEEGESADGSATLEQVKENTEAVPAATGFIHLLPPTPENWTNSLPHRTQVVYTPDYSYILHRIRARPGSNLIEAGAGSGSFTHASARAVFQGYPGSEGADSSQRLGKVWSFEFHEQRHEKLQLELKEHELEGIVEVTHRDVCEDGFLVNGESPKADAVFLDLPAPWLALPHLVRSKVPTTPLAEHESSSSRSSEETKPFISPLNPKAAVQICTFSPCIEQVQKTVSVMRQYGWVDIDMVEVAHKRFEIRRERIGIDKGAERGMQTTPASVEEALQRLLEVEGNFQKFHSTGEKVDGRKKAGNPNSRQAIVDSLVERKVYKEGRLVHRTEPEVKQHTSYLVFASLPMEWSAEDEKKAREEWPVKFRREDETKEDANGNPEPVAMSRRQLKRAARQAQKDRAAANGEPAGDVDAVALPVEEQALHPAGKEVPSNIEEVLSIEATVLDNIQ